jgi:hypothetical protein
MAYIHRPRFVLRDLDFDTSLDPRTVGLAWTLQSDTGKTQTWVCRIGWVFGETKVDKWDFGYHGEPACGMQKTLDNARRFFDEQVEGLLVQRVVKALGDDGDD